MPILSRVSSRHSTRATLSATASVVVLLGLSTALAEWQGSPAVGVLAVVGCALMVNVFVAVRRVLRRASAQIDAILGEELGCVHVESRDKVR